MDKPVDIVFVGAGAVGCFYASRLWDTPDRAVRVSLIGRSNYAALARDGVQLQTRSFGDYVFRPHAVYPSVAAAAATKWDYVVVTTKALPDRGDDAATVAALVGSQTVVVLIQNGVGVEAPYRARFPQTPLVSGVTVVSAEQLRPGVVWQNRWTRLHLGPVLDTEEAKAAVHFLTASWSAGGIRDVDPLDAVGLQMVRWHKLCINAAFNPSAVLAGGRGNADMAADPELRAHLRAVMDEIWLAAPRILGRPFPPEFASPDRILASTDRNPGARPSMLLDWQARRPLELEVILGNPVRIARAHGVDLPRLQSLYALLRSAQAMREKEEEAAKGAKGKL